MEKKILKIEVHNSLFLLSGKEFLSYIRQIEAYQSDFD
jgi:hypothetical protein